MKQEPIKWSDWNPAAFPDSLTIQEILSSMPQSPVEGIPRIIQLFENPSSPYSLCGPTDLKTHDIIHILLGRGLLQQDEAFVIGYSMGNASNASALDRMWFLQVATKKYPKPFTFSSEDARIFNLAFDFGMDSDLRNINSLNALEFLGLSLADARKKVALSKKTLADFYKREVSAVGPTKVSARLSKAFELTS